MNKTSLKPSASALPSLGVVIPTYNEEEVIANCLNALKAQSEDIEAVVVVNNNSTDATAAIVTEIAKEWPKVHLIVEEKPGVVPARNRGMNFISSEIIARIDADTIVEERWARSWREFFGDKKNDHIAASVGIAIPYDLPFPRLAEVIYNVFILQSNRLVTNADGLFGTNMATRQTAWKQIKDQVCSKRNIMEDMDIGLHLMEHGLRVRAARNARVRFSARRMLTNPISYLQYAAMWPRTYSHHGKMLSAAVTWPFAIIGSLLQAIIWPVLRSYDPERRRFSIKRLFSKQKTRVIPHGS